MSPIYTHRCSDCGHTFDVLRTIAEFSETAECPGCKARAPRDWGSVRFVAHGGPTTGGGTGKNAAAGRHTQKKKSRKSSGHSGREGV